MHLFLYKASRHERPAGYYRTRRLVQGTYRNDFDLDLIKSGIKGRYTILPHGSNAFQARLKDFGLEEEFYGHIIEVPEAKNAIWFKLNYDNIGKPGTNYIGSWKQLDTAELSKFDLPYQDTVRRLSALNQEFQQLRYHASTLAAFLSNRNGYSEHMDVVRKTGEIYRKDLEDAMPSIQNEINQCQLKLAGIREEIRAYMKTRQF